MGDPAGIGPEITVRALNSAAVYEKCRPVVFGDAGALLDACVCCGIELKINRIASPEECTSIYGVIDCADISPLDREERKPGIVSARCGNASFNYITGAISLAMESRLDAVVTGPINKAALNMAGHSFAGHTEIFAHYTGAEKGSFAMMLSCGNLRVLHVTTHVSLRAACEIITEERVSSAIRLAELACVSMGIESPRIAVAGLNPHSSEDGLFGTEEKEAIAPAILNARAAGMNAEGPVPPDTVFVKAVAGVYDIVVAMYHDQGHIPLKLHGFRMDAATGALLSVSGVNTTVGLPIIRTSVDHGTAFDRAGKNSANPESMLEAIEMAVVMAKSRKETP